MFLLYLLAFGSFFNVYMEKLLYFAKEFYIMLTELERDRLVNREKFSGHDRHNNDFVIRSKLKAWLEDIDDVILILKHLPHRQLEKMLIDDNVFGLFQVVTSLIHLLKFGRIEEIRGKFVVFDEIVSPNKEIKVKGRYAVDEDLKRAIEIGYFFGDIARISTSREVFSSCFWPPTIWAAWRERKRVLRDGAIDETIYNQPRASTISVSDHRKEVPPKDEK
jgi:hypothetical protein